MSGAEMESASAAAVAYRAGLPPRLRRAAAELYWDAFGRQLAPILGGRDAGVRVLERAMVASRAVVALEGGELVGIAGLDLGRRPFIAVRPAHLIAAFGWLGGALRSLPFLFLHRRRRRGELLIDGIVVRADRRGVGIGAGILRAVYAIARGRGFSTVRLDVMDTNPGARRLYAREGFVAERTERVPILRGLLGFAASTRMVRAVGSDGFPPRGCPARHSTA